MDQYISRGMLETLFRSGRAISFNDGQLILAADEVPEGVDYVESGLVKVYSLTNNGTLNLHIIYKPGDIYPLIWAIHGLPRSVFYEALGPVRIRRIPREKFISAVETDSDVAMAVISRLTTSFALYADRLDNLELSSAYHRVVHRLLTLADRFGERSPHGILLPALMTHSLIASSIKMSRETASREIEKLVAKGLVRYYKRRILVIDCDKLRQQLPV